MAKKEHSEEQILRALWQAEGGTKVADICRDQRGLLIHSKEEVLRPSELCELRPLREENSKFKRPVANLPLDRYILQEIMPKNCKASPATRTGVVDAIGVRPRRARVSGLMMINRAGMS